ncbi:hypothetical protein N0V84_011832, partial [Fusarium piperis]
GRHHRHGREALLTHPRVRPGRDPRRRHPAHHGGDPGTAGDRGHAQAGRGRPGPHEAAAGGEEARGGHAEASPGGWWSWRGGGVM